MQRTQYSIAENSSTRKDTTTRYPWRSR